MNFYIDNKLIGTSAPLTIIEETNFWEFYLRRKGWYYFRRFGSVLKVELTENNSKKEDLSKLKYGMKLEIVSN